MKTLFLLILLGLGFSCSKSNKTSSAGGEDSSTQKDKQNNPGSNESRPEIGDEEFENAPACKSQILKFDQVIQIKASDLGKISGEFQVVESRYEIIADNKIVSSGVEHTTNRTNLKSRKICGNQRALFTDNLKTIAYRNVRFINDSHLSSSHFAVSTNKTNKELIRTTVTQLSKLEKSLFSSGQIHIPNNQSPESTDSFIHTTQLQISRDIILKTQTKYEANHKDEADLISKLTKITSPSSDYLKINPHFAAIYDSSDSRSSQLGQMILNAQLEKNLRLSRGARYSVLSEYCQNPTNEKMISLFNRAIQDEDLDSDSTSIHGHQLAWKINSFTNRLHGRDMTHADSSNSVTTYLCRGAGQTLSAAKTLFQMSLHLKGLYGIRNESLYALSIPGELALGFTVDDQAGNKQLFMSSLKHKSKKSIYLGPVQDIMTWDIRAFRLSDYLIFDTFQSLIEPVKANSIIKELHARVAKDWGVNLIGLTTGYLRYPNEHRPRFDLGNELEARDLFAFKYRPLKQETKKVVSPATQERHYLESYLGNSSQQFELKLNSDRILELNISNQAIQEIDQRSKIRVDAQGVARRSPFGNEFIDEFQKECGNKAVFGFSRPLDIKLIDKSSISRTHMKTETIYQTLGFTKIFAYDPRTADSSIQYGYGSTKQADLDNYPASRLINVLARRKAIIASGKSETTDNFPVHVLFTKDRLYGLTCRHTQQLRGGDDKKVSFSPRNYLMVGFMSDKKSHFDRKGFSQMNRIYFNGSIPVEVEFQCFDLDRQETRLCR